MLLGREEFGMQKRTDANPCAGGHEAESSSVAIIMESELVILPCRLSDEYLVMKCLCRLMLIQSIVLSNTISTIVQCKLSRAKSREVVLVDGLIEGFCFRVASSFFHTHNTIHARS